jgi:hypothetical protein
MQQAWEIIRSDIIEYIHLILTLWKPKPIIKNNEKQIIYNVEASVDHGLGDPVFEFQ